MNLSTPREYENKCRKIRENLLNLIKINEGFESRIYKDTKGKLSIGYGFNLDDCEIPILVAENWLMILIDNLYLNLSTLFDFFDSLNEARKAVLVDMAYNMGVEGLLKFKKMLKYLKERNYEDVAEEMENSNWYDQVPNRAEKLIKMMVSGEFYVS